MAPQKSLRVLCLVAALLLLSAPAAAANDALPLYSDDPMLVWFESGLILEGLVPPTAVYPVSQRELEFRGLLPQHEPSPPVQNSFTFTLRPVFGVFSLGPAGPVSRTGDAFSELATLLYWSLPPFLEASDVFTVGDWLRLSLCFDQRFDAGKMAGPGGSLFSAYAWESSAPRQGSLTVAIDHFDFAAGRTRAGIGHGYFGNPFLNGRANYYDHIRFSAYAGDFKFTYLCGTSDPLLTPAERRIQSKPWHTTPYSEPYKTYVYKRLEYRPFGQLLVGLGEASVVGGISPDLQSLNPFGIWHNTYSQGYQNSMHALDVSIVPLRGLHLFGELVIDDIRLGREGGSRMPTALAWQLGSRYVLPLSEETRLMAGLEYTHVDPWTYNAFQPYLMFYQRQTFCSMVNDWYMDVPLGYAFGSDLDHYGAYLRLISRTGLQAALSYYHMVQGQVELEPYDGNQTWYNVNDGVDLNNGHVGVPEIVNSLGVRLSLPVSGRLALVCTGDVCWINNYGHVTGAAGLIYALLLGLEYRL